MKPVFILFLLLVSSTAQAQSPSQPTPGTLIDVLTLGNSASEKVHAVLANRSDVVRGGLAESARRLLPPATTDWQGGSLSFTMQVDPILPNYITVRLWGSDVNPNRLLLFCADKQVGYRHLGDIDLLDLGSEAPFYTNHFFYNTSPLPIELTKGKRTVQLEIRSNGPIWGYGQTWETYQKPMTQPSRGIYGIYTHTDGAFIPPATEKQCIISSTARIRQTPGQEVMDKLKGRINAEISRLLGLDKALSQVQMQFLAKARRVKWSKAYQNPQVISQVIRGLDEMVLAYQKNPRLAEADLATYNAEWFGTGICGQVLYLLGEPLKPHLDGVIMGSDRNPINRRTAYADMLVTCRDWHQRHRRMYTNQSMINDLYGIYYANKGLATIAPKRAVAESEIRRYLYESVGLQPWLGSDGDDGPSRSAGDQYRLLTSKGLTKELGYVGNYGEVLDWVSEIYEATRPSPEQPGDERIKTQIEKIALARVPFRYSSLDDDANQAMRLETSVGWRDTHYPGDVTYVQRPSWDGSPLQIAATTLHPQLISYAQQLLTDNQYFESVAKRMADKGFRVTAGLLATPDEYELIKAQPAHPAQLPMSWDQPDYVFTDEEDGVVAVKNGNEIFYASLYWRARFAINFLARVHCITPQFDRVATVRETEEFEPSGQTYVRADWTNFGFGNGGIPYPDSVHSAHTGERLPIAKIPAGVPYKPGDESPYAGKAQFYRLQYGNYLIGMNSTTDKMVELTVPSEFRNARNLRTNQKISGAGSLPVSPGTTVILFR